MYIFAGAVFHVSSFARNGAQESGLSISVNYQRVGNGSPGSWIPGFQV